MRKAFPQPSCCADFQYFNGAATYSLRKANTGYSIPIRWKNFNGAATYSLRKARNMSETEVFIKTSMGPQHTRCGKCICSVPPGTFSRLQWGRNILVAESRRKYVLMLDFICGLQWGRNILVAERRRKWICPEPLGASLQWGRNILVAERRTTSPTRGATRNTSMGPQHTRCGKSKARHATPPARHFNGAATYSLRKVAYCHASAHCIINFNGAATYSLRKGFHRSSFASDSRYFNGAATYSLRKVQEHIADHICCNHFNGAATYSLRKVCHTSGYFLESILLQWGRNILVAESSSSALTRQSTLQLQWGRNILVAES